MTREEQKQNNNKKVRPDISSVVHKFDLRIYNLGPVDSHRSLQWSGEDLNDFADIRTACTVL